MIEVLEHLKDPGTVLRELYRVLKQNGVLVASMPYLSAIHMYTSSDFQRWTGKKIRMELEKAGFKTEKIISVGGIVAVVTDLFHSHVHHSPGIMKKTLNKLLEAVSPLLLYFDRNTKDKDRITTGYFIRAKK